MKMGKVTVFVLKLCFRNEVMFTQCFLECFKCFDNFNVVNVLLLTGKWKERQNATIGAITLPKHWNIASALWLLQIVILFKNLQETMKQWGNHWRKHPNLPYFWFSLNFHHPCRNIFEFIINVANNFRKLSPSENDGLKFRWTRNWRKHLKTLWSRIPGKFSE